MQHTPHLVQQANYNLKIPTHWFTLTPYSNQDQQHEKWKIIKTLKCEQTNSYLWLMLNIRDNQIVNWHTLTTFFTLLYIRVRTEILLYMVLRCKTYTFHCKIKQMWLYKAKENTLGFQWHNREFYKNGNQCGRKKTIFPYITG